MAEARAQRFQGEALAHQCRHQRDGQHRAPADGDARRAGRGHRRCVLCAGARHWAAEPCRLAGLAEGRGGAARARSRHLGAASRLAQSAAVLAVAPGASRRPRYRRHHGGTLSSGRDRLVDAVEDRGGGAARRPAARGVPVRGDPQRLRHVQPRQYRASGAGRWGPSPVRRDPRHAPRASLRHPARARFKLRLQSLALGPAVPHLYRAARGRPPGHDHRAHALPERSAGAGSAGACGCRSASSLPVRRSSSGNSAGTALHSDRWRAPARARN